jgi:mono/diheme cytochrome c family protein
MGKSVRWAMLLGAFIPVVSCGVSYLSPPVNPQMVEQSRHPKDVLQRGYVVHQQKCAKCHGYEDPANHEVEELTDEILPAMARKSKLGLADEQAVTAYLLAARQVPRPDQGSR